MVRLMPLHALTLLALLSLLTADAVAANIILRVSACCELLSSVQHAAIHTSLRCADQQLHLRSSGRHACRLRPSHTRSRCRRVFNCKCASFVFTLHLCYTLKSSTVKFAMLCLYLACVPAGIREYANAEHALPKPYISSLYCAPPFRLLTHQQRAQSFVFQ